MTEQATKTDWNNDPDLSDTWKFRFAFFDKYGTPSLFSAKHPAWEALKTFPWEDKLKINANIWAFFFSFIYLAILGLIPQAVLLFGVIVALGIVSAVLPENVVIEAFFNFVGFVLAAYTARMTNIWYYRKRVQGISEWTLK
ncbi:hypothetical protein AGMMS49960_18710 [Betaproteobacteria bacterium]|nr:hypothetical protein AGMMS49543_16140 [Betaproteobacteria bacterium]GHU03814.1 hypothetical protein AGMMS49960_18710 [Betaproteobacteria bacterium]GHU10320.1 hypothetical protein AGMMS50225_13480 [Betaproteobacteria bacterium]GHU24185.1 hypothetical protein AGMMS50243_26920 [Betaproteobacteria bacterium]